MPANLTADYLAAEQAYKRAATPEEKIAALEQMFAALPKHKGTEKMQADIRRRLSEARKESQKGRKAGAPSAPAYLIKREGAGQILLIGPPNSGKSSLVRALTHAHPEVGDYPFTTRMPTAGMMPFEDIQIQLVDLPPVSAGFMEPWLGQVVRPARHSALVIDPNDPEVLDEIEVVLKTLEEWHAPAPALLTGNKMDLAGAADNFRTIQELLPGRFRAIGVSAFTGEDLPKFARVCFDALEIVRFYSKAPGRKADLEAPYVLPRGATVEEAAAHVHRDFAEHFRYARLFGRSHGQDGLMVERTHAVADGDVLEFHLMANA